MPYRAWRAALALLLMLPASAALARSCPLTINADDAMRFDRSELRVPADCSSVTLTLHHTGRQKAGAMGHNWVLTRTPDYRQVAIAGGRARLADSYLPAGDARIIAHTPVIGGGESATVTFSTAALSHGGDYTFFCSFPGHWNVMRGKLVFE